MGDDDDDDDSGLDAEPERFAQMTLVTTILGYLDRCGIKGMIPRHMNAVIQAANLIVDAVNTPPVAATPGSGLNRWLASDDTGLSSVYMAGVLSGRPGVFDADWPGVHYPRDPADFGRCVRMLDACPDLRPNLPRLSAPEHGPVWPSLVGVWPELEALYREEYPSGTAPRLFDRMKALIDAAHG